MTIYSFQEFSMRSFIAFAAIASLHAATGTAFADDRTETAVRLFLGMGNGSAVTADKVSSENDDVVVKNLVLPMNGGAPGANAKIHVKEMRFVGVEAVDAEMSFKGIAGSGLMISGEEAIAARSMVMGPGRAKNLGVAAFAVDGDLSLTFMDIVAPSKSGTVRVSSYSLSTTGDPAGVFKQSARFDGVRSDQLKLGSASDGIQAEMSISGDGQARELDGTMSIKQAQFGEIRAKFSMERIEPANDRLSLMLGYGLFAGAPKLKQASLSYMPAEQIRTMLMFMSGDQRKQMAGAVSPFVQGQLGLDEEFARAAAAEVEKFLAMPVRLSIAFSPATPIGITEVQAASGDTRAESKASLLGISIKSGQ